MKQTGLRLSYLWWHPGDPSWPQSPPPPSSTCCTAGGQLWSCRPRARSARGWWSWGSRTGPADSPWSGCACSSDIPGQKKTVTLCTLFTSVQMHQRQGKCRASQWGLFTLQTQPITFFQENFSLLSSLWWTHAGVIHKYIRLIHFKYSKYIHHILLQSPLKV